MPTTPFTVALTGGIASGKTAVSDRFAALGASVVDTDRISREVLEPGSDGLEEVCRAFGQGVLGADGGLDRAAMRERVFSDEAARRKLEAIVHPRVRRRARALVREATGPYVVLVVPLLVETGLFQDADRVLVVDVPEEVQVERLVSRDGGTREQVRAMLDAQATRQQRLSVADDRIDNSGGLDDLDKAVARLDAIYREKAAATSNRRL